MRPMHDRNDPDDERSTAALARAIEGVFGEASREALTVSTEAIQERLAELEQRVIAEFNAHTESGSAIAERVVQRLTEMNVDLNHALVSLTEALSATNQRLSKIDIAMGERIGAIQERLIENAKSFDDRVNAASQILSEATARLGAAREGADRQLVALEAKLISIEKALSEIYSHVESFNAFGRRLASLEPRLKELAPKVDAGPIALRAVEERLGAVEASSRNASASIRALRTQNIVLITIATVEAAALLAGLYRIAM
jgi:DNA repair ATPase RecN